MKQEAKIIGDPTVTKNRLSFQVQSIKKEMDIHSICGRCSIESICFGTFYPNGYRKDANIDLSNKRVQNIDSSNDSSNCGIIIEIQARKNSVQPGFTPTRKAFGSAN